MSKLKLLPESIRPREKLLQQGPKSLSEAELLAIFLRTGLPGKNVIQLAQEIVQYFGGIKNLFAANIKEFTQIKGLGQAKYVQLQACLEMTRRYLHDQLQQTEVLSNPNIVKDFLRNHLADRPNEVFAALFLNNQNHILSYEELFLGTINCATVHPRIVAQRALKLNAAAVILAHNHPSAIAEASVADINITHALKETLNLLDVRLLDHFIIAGQKIVSMAEEGKI